MRHVMVGLAAVGNLVMVAAAQPRKPHATLSLSEASVAAQVGFSWGNGDAGPGEAAAARAARASVGIGHEPASRADPGLASDPAHGRRDHRGTGAADAGTRPRPAAGLRPGRPGCERPAAARVSDRISGTVQRGLVGPERGGHGCDG